MNSVTKNMYLKMNVFCRDENFIKPTRAHYNDCGLDRHSAITIDIEKGETARIPLGVGFDFPDGYVGLLCPRSSMNTKGLDVKLGIIDSGYKGEINAVLINNSGKDVTIRFNDKICQLLLVPCQYIEPIDIMQNERNKDGFGSTGE